MAAEYRLSFAAAVWSTPLSLALVLLPVRNERHGGTTGPAYTTDANIKARNRCRAWLEANFTIVPDPPAITGWKL